MKRFVFSFPFVRARTLWCGVLLFIFSCIGQVNCGNCHKGVHSEGWTEPAGDIILREGQPIKIKCVLDPEIAAKKNYSSNQIFFTRNNQTIPNEYVTIINDTVAQLFMPNVSEMNDWFYCKLASNQSTENSLIIKNSLEQSPAGQNVSDPLTICHNLVAVGGPPKDIERVSCVSYDWKVLNCSWSVPDNKIRTTYRISYATPKRGGGRVIHECPAGNHEETENWCAWSNYTKPQYRRFYPELYIYMYGNNTFDQNRQSPSILFNHYAHILPSKPRNLQAVEKTTSSIYLKWNIDDLILFGKGWIYNVSYLRDKEEGWNSTLYQSKTLFKNGSDVFLNLTNLKYPNSVYDIRVSMKSSVAQSDQYWSENADLIVKTKACIPYRSPRTDIGSFEIVNHQMPSSSSRIVYVYWQPLSPLEYNGDNFRYEIVVFEDGKETNLKPNLTKYSYAKYEINFGSYTFYIYSANKEGRSQVAGRVHVPKDDSVLRSPVTVSKIYHGGSAYEMSWKPSDANKIYNVHNYTVFWCESNKEYPYQCEGYIDWIQVPANETKHNFSMNSTKGYQFAVSANSATGISSGLTWASCTVIHDRITKIKNVRVYKEESYSIMIDWKLECSERIDTLKGYKIYYCPINSSNPDSHCSGPSRNLTIYGDLDTQKGNITDLEPYTFYKISISMFTANSTGPSSDVIVGHTEDGKPDISNIKLATSKEPTNTSISLKWTTPKATNGVLRYYMITFGHGGDKNTTVVNANETETNLTNLNSFEEYHIQLQACTLHCSVLSEPIMVRTKIGKPGLVHGSSNSLNSSHVNITWQKPEMPGGPSPTYRVRIKYHGDATKTDREFLTVENNTVVDLTSCTNGTFTVQIRAENVAENNRSLYPGEWSKEINNICLNGLSMSPLLKVVIGIVLFILSAAIAITAVSKFLNKWKEMQKVEVSLPPKFTMAPTVTPLFKSEIKDRVFYEDFSSPLYKSVEEFHNLVDKSTELDVFSSQPR